MKLWGNVCIRNAFELDYCFKECVQSLLPVCDVVCVSDGESTDGTQEFIRDWMTREPKIALCIYKWPNPVGNPNFWVEWLNYNRAHIPSDCFQIQLDADEVLSEEAYPEIEQIKTREGLFTVRMRRHNFWRDAKSLIPDGICCSHEVIRMGPQNVFIPSDGEHPEGAQWVAMAQWSERIKVFHYGFLRKREAWFKKARALQGMFFNSYDPRLEKAEQDGGDWSTHASMPEWVNQLRPFAGTHPKIIEPWLKERGYE